LAETPGTEDSRRDLCSILFHWTICGLFFSNWFSSLFHFRIYTSGLCFSLFVKYLSLHSLKLKPPYLSERLIKSELIYLRWCPRS